MELHQMAGCLLRCGTDHFTTSSRTTLGANLPMMLVSGHRNLEAPILLASNMSAGQISTIIVDAPYGGMQIRIAGTTTADDGRYRAGE